MTDQTPKKTEELEAAKPSEKTKVTETAADKDQATTFRAIRKEAVTKERAFSLMNLKTLGSGSSFELVDGDKQVAAATKNVAKPVDMNAATKDAEAIRKATGNDNYIARWADKDAINKILEGKTETERKAIDNIYREKYGRGLEEEMRAFEKGSDLDKFLNILHRKDDNAENSAARRVHQDILENHNLVQGRSSSQIEKDIRDLLSTRNADQIAKMDQEYKQTYGVSLKDVIRNDDKLSQATKEMADVYFKGNDKRTDQDTAKLIDVALREQNTELFAESMRDASPAARKTFLDNGGEQRVNDAFGHWYSDSAVQHAMDYAREGKLSASTQIKDNTGIAFDNDKGVELAINRMTAEERRQYQFGKAFSEGKMLPGMTLDEQQKAAQYYKEVHSALDGMANAKEMIKFEDMIAGKAPAENKDEKPAEQLTVEQRMDKIHTAIVGWGGSSEIVSELKALKPQELDVIKSEYALKYGSSFEGDLMEKLGGQDRDAAERVLTQNLSADERANIARNQSEQARSGFGASMSDHVFRSGTGDQADDAVNQTNRALAEQNKLNAAIASGTEMANNMTPEQMQQLQQQLTARINESIGFQNEATDNAVESKKAAANYVADGAILAAAVGSVILTGGADLPLVVGLAVAGAGVKVGTNVALQGNNYDLSLSQVGMDAGIGSLTAATAVIGPGEIAAVFGIGRTAATEAAGLAVKELGEAALVSGGKEALESGTREIVQNALASGAKKLNPAEFTSLANEVVSTKLVGEAREQAVRELSLALQKNVSEQIGTGVYRQVAQHGLNAAGGAAAGGVTGTAEGITEWDPNKSTAENLAHIGARAGEGAVGGAIIGGGLSLATSGLGKAWELARGANEADSAVSVALRDASHEWPRVEPHNVEAVRTQVRVELGQVKASDGGNVLEKLNNSGLSEAQKTRVLDSLGEVRENYAKTFATDIDQPVNWIHTQGELGRVLDAAKSAGLTPAQTEDALLASMFSDSVKTKANFTTHHLDGEKAAERVLKEKLGGDFTQERLDGILHAVREHQIAPPAFMAMIYGGAIRRSIAAEGRALTEQESAALGSLLKKMSDPFKSAHVDAAGGGKMLDLTDMERSLLKRTGADNWHVPSEGTPWYKISRALIDGDGIDNYATPGGLSKIIQIRGPETGPFFKDGNFRFENPERAAGSPPSSSQESWRDSFKDFANVASPDGLNVARAAASDAEKSALSAQARVDTWLHERLGIPADKELPVVPGWTGKPKLDAAGKPMIDVNGRPIMQPDNLKYPDYEQKWWDIHNKPASARNAEEKAFYEDPVNRYRGLNDQQIRDFKLAQEIRDRYAAELRKEQRVAGDAAPQYKPVVQPRKPS